MSTSTSRFAEWVRSLRITVEPLMLVLSACNTVRSIVTPELSELKMRRTYAAPLGLTDQELKKFYNKKMVIWDNNYTYVNLPIACIVGIMVDHSSENPDEVMRFNMDLREVVINPDAHLRILIWSPEVDISLYWVYPTAVVVGLMGDFMLTMSCINAYITDKFGKRDALSTRMIVVSLMFSLGSLAASQCTKYILKVISPALLLVIVEGIMLVVVVACAIFLGNTTPKKKLVSKKDDEEVPSTSFWEVTKRSFYSIYASLVVFVLSREGHRRLFLYLTFTANFIDQLVFGEEKSLIGTYTRLSPFNWDAKKYADYKSIRPIVQISGMILGLFVLKKWLKLRDTSVIFWTIVTMGLQCVVIGLAYDSWMIYLSLAIGSLHGLLNPLCYSFLSCLVEGDEDSWMIYLSLAIGSLHGLLNPLCYSFLSCLVEGDEVGKTFAISSIAQKMAGFVQTAVLQNIYIATVDWYQGFIWLLIGGICAIAAGIYGYIHVVAKQENIGH
ncbi:hypothetical protein OESDEN_13802 [Oesophagostomum dentatum]|uniref:Transporter, major facilitator family protein n=1 Tax=Oesophagostomum dentatum TaxID=61180 RepID=A0A0B1SSE8_OESDE|nr:hypothetical protein OESDEN_13802 [Oesophagostomum dentatum]